MTPNETLLREAVSALRNVAAVMQRLLDEPDVPACEQHLTVREVAGILKCSITVVGDEIRRGALKAVRVGKGRQKAQYRVSPSALAAFQKKRSQ